MTARAANIRALRELAGLTDESAAQALDAIVVLTGPSNDETIALLELVLGRTLRVTRNALPGAVAEIVIGGASQRLNVPGLAILGYSDHFTVGPAARPTAPVVPLPGIFGLVAAAYAAALAVHVVIHDSSSLRTIEVRFQDYLAADRQLSTSVVFERAHLAGAGAVGNGYLLGLALLPLSGELVIADPDVVDAGNLNRQVLFGSQDVGKPKADICAAWLSAATHGRVRAIPEGRRLQEVADRSNGAWLRQLVVGVDSRRARRGLADELPLHFFDASTTGIEDVFLNFGTAGTPTACLRCAYPEDAAELAHERHVAETLGVELDDVRRQLIDSAAAERIARRYPSHHAEEFVGLAFDSVFRALCGAGELRGASQSARAVTAPLAYVSVLAGALLALEFYRRVGREDVGRPFGSWHVHPQMPPVTALRRAPPVRPGCACGSSLVARTVRRLWAA